MSPDPAPAPGAGRPAPGDLLALGGLVLALPAAQYWTWSRELDWSYATKGPLVAWGIALGNTLFGPGESALRALAWASHGLFLVLVFLFALDLWGSRRAAWSALALALTTPLYFLLGGVMTTDVFLFACWTGALWAAWRALARGRRRAWYAMGLAVGVGALAKLSIGLLPLFTGLAMALHRPWRRLFLAREPWLAAAIVALCMAPMIAWNAANGWVALRHEQGHVLGHGDPSGHLGEFLAGQFIALSPVVAGLLALALVRPPREPGRRLVWLVSAGVLGFFLVKAGLSKVQPNWPAPAYIGLMVLVAGQLGAWGAAGRRWLAAGLAVAAAMVLVLHLPGLAGIPSDRDPFLKLKAWEEPVARLAARLPEARFLLASRYGLVAELSYYWPRRLPVYQVGARHRRLSQYDLWPGPGRHAGRDGAYVSTRARLPETVAGAFEACTPVPPVVARGADGRPLRTLRAWACRGFRAPDWPEPRRH